jgi:hypothetical protein
LSPIRYDSLIELLERGGEFITAIELIDYILVTIIEFLIAGDGCARSIRLIVRSRDIDITRRILEFSFPVLVESEFDTCIICIDESEVFRSHSEEESLESIRQIMSRIFIDCCSVEIDEEILEPHFFHTLHCLFG